MSQHEKLLGDHTLIIHIQHVQIIQQPWALSISFRRLKGNTFQDLSSSMYYSFSKGNYGELYIFILVRFSQEGCNEVEGIRNAVAPPIRVDDSWAWTIGQCSTKSTEKCRVFYHPPPAKRYGGPWHIVPMTQHGNGKQSQEIATLSSISPWSLSIIQLLIADYTVPRTNVLAIYLPLMIHDQY